METTVLKVEEIQCLRELFQDDEGRFFYDWRRWDTESAGFLELREASPEAILRAMRGLHQYGLDADAYIKERSPGAWEVYDGEHKPLYKVNIW